MNPVAKKISELPAFVAFSEKQVKEVNGAYYEIKSLSKENGVYSFKLEVLDKDSKSVKEFEIESYLNNSKVVLEGITF